MPWLVGYPRENIEIYRRENLAQCEEGSPDR